MVLGIRGSTEQSVGGTSSFGRAGSGRAHNGDVVVYETLSDDVDNIGRKLADTSAWSLLDSWCLATMSDVDTYHQISE